MKNVKVSSKQKIINRSKRPRFPVKGKSKKKNLKNEESNLRLDVDNSGFEELDDFMISSSDVNIDKDESLNDDNSFDSADDTSTDDVVEHKKALNNLKEADPEFYKYLEENDKKLLNFDVSDSENDSDNVEKLPDNDGLEVDSEEEDYKPHRKSFTTGQLVTLAMVSDWSDKVKSDASIENISTLVKVFHAALKRVTGEEPTEYRVEGAAVFNAVIEMCIVNLLPAVKKFLKLPSGPIKHPESKKKWVKVRSTLQDYLTDLIKLVSGVTSEDIISVLLKHLHGCCPLLAYFHKQCRICLKLLSKLWGTGKETIRVLAYLCILKLATNDKESNNLLNSALKLMYLEYVKNTKFVTMNCLTEISFMRRSLADLLTIKPSLSYQHAFLYIRQLAIHLRNAITLRKKERFQTVYNWQYINSLHLWIELLCSQKEELKQLAFPVITIITGVIKLIPTAQYIPLRIHCVRMLIKLTKHTDIFIPVLPYIMECFTIVNLSTKQKKLSMKPFEWTCVLRLSKAAMTETAFLDSVVDNSSSVLIEAAAIHHSSISFPDLILPTIVGLKEITKTTTHPKYTNKLKQILSKFEENARFIECERSKTSIDLSDMKSVNAFEANIRLKGTPLEKYWEMFTRKQNLQFTKRDSEKISESQIPEGKKGRKRKQEERDQASDDDPQEISSLLCNIECDNARKKKSDDTVNSLKKEHDSAESDIADASDIIEDFNLSSF